MPRKDPEERRAYRRAYQRAYRRAYRAAHREEDRARFAVYRASHPEQIRARCAVYNAAHPEVYLAGERTQIDQLPPELRQVALLIRETRRIIRSQRSGGTS
jgi:hypothetical protein